MLLLISQIEAGRRNEKRPTVSSIYRSELTLFNIRVFAGLCRQRDKTPNTPSTGYFKLTLMVLFNSGSGSVCVRRTHVMCSMYAVAAFF